MERPPQGSRCHPIDELRVEHRVIRTLLDSVEAEVRRMQQSYEVRLAFWLPALDFFEHFADQDHHRKEEDLLFAALEGAGLAASATLALLRQEHERGRSARGCMVQAVASQDVHGLARTATGYVRLLRQHLDREDLELFPLAQGLGERLLLRLRTAFDEHAAGVGEEQRARLLAIADRLGRAAAGEPPG